MEKTHDCISKVRDNLKKDNPKIGYVRFMLSNIQDLSKKDGIEMTGQAIEYSYTHVSKSGKVSEKTAKSFVTHIYCPFCGEKY